MRQRIHRCFLSQGIDALNTGRAGREHDCSHKNAGIIAPGDGTKNPLKASKAAMRERSS
jgi:hypothetical protein